MSAFRRGQANEKKVQDLLAVLSSNIQHFCSSRTFSCCCILLPYILFSPIERKQHQWHMLFFMFTLHINGCAEKTKITMNSFWFLARNYIRSTSIPLCLLFKRNCVRPFSFSFLFYHGSVAQWVCIAVLFFCVEYEFSK